MRCFQSIGDTKDWRLAQKMIGAACGLPFPINRRHQRLETPPNQSGLSSVFWFPINRRHQRSATTSEGHHDVVEISVFPINRCHQRLAAWWSYLRYPADLASGFLINRCHEGLATALPKNPYGFVVVSFQSIGVTKDWRLVHYSTDMTSFAMVSNQ